MSDRVCRTCIHWEPLDENATGVCRKIAIVQRIIDKTPLISVDFDGFDILQLDPVSPSCEVKLIRTQSITNANFGCNFCEE